MKDYPIETSQDEFARLGMQADLFRADAESMLDRLGIEPGWRCLDLCCGIGGITDLLSRRLGPEGLVIGADLDPDKLAFARRWAAARDLGNVRFVRSDAFETPFEPASFDLVHCRFAISVISHGLGILDSLLSLARPGGIVFVEEPDTRTMACVPGDADWDRALAVMNETFARIGANVHIGPDLHGIFRAKGLADLQARPCLHALKADDPMTLHLPSTLAAMRETVVSLGLIGARDLATLIERLRARLLEPATLTVSFAMYQVVGRMPEEGR